MVNKGSKAQTLVMHSNRTTFMPDKIRVHYRNSRKKEIIWVAFHLVLHMQHEYEFYSLTLGPQVLSFMTSQKKKKQISCMFFESSRKLNEVLKSSQQRVTMFFSLCKQAYKPFSSLSYSFVKNIHTWNGVADWCFWIIYAKM